MKEQTLKDPTLGNIDRKISHYDIYQVAADGGRLWLNKKDDTSIWIDTFEYLIDILKGK